MKFQYEALLERASSTTRSLGNRSLFVWQKYRALNKKWQIAIAVFLVVLLFGFHSIIGIFTGKADAGDTLPAVELSQIGELTGNGSGSVVVGSVRSVSEASILAESGGKITAVHTALGKTVGAGTVLAEIDNASQRAAVLQAQGSYEAALAGRAGVSPGDVAGSARNTYSSSYSALDIALKTYIDTFYGDYGPQGPKYLVSSSPFDPSYFPAKRAALANDMNAWRAHLASADSTDPQTLLTEAETITREASALANDMSSSATRVGTDVSSTQLTALATARSSIASTLASINAAKIANKSQGSSSTLGADASVKIALGTLRAAQAALEKTLIRTPIGGTVNFFPIRRGDYVTPLMHVATVAQNGALEVVVYMSEATRANISVGQKVTIEGKYAGVITSIAPALDPVTKQIEVHVGVNGESDLVNGQSVHIALPTQMPAVTSTTATSTGPILLPLTAVKLAPSSRIVFSVGADSRLVAHQVQIGDVRGDRIEVLTPLPSDLSIVVDARGRTEGEKVQVTQPLQ